MAERQTARATDTPVTDPAGKGKAHDPLRGARVAIRVLRGAGCLLAAGAVGALLTGGWREVPFALEMAAGAAFCLGIASRARRGDTLF